MKIGRPLFLTALRAVFAVERRRGCEPEEIREFRRQEASSFDSRARRP